MSSNTNILGCALISTQGLPIYSNLAKDVNDGIFCAIIAAFQGISERVVKELVCGDLKQIFIKGTEGDIILSKAGENAILCILAINGKNISSFESPFFNFKRRFDDDGIIGGTAVW